MIRLQWIQWAVALVMTCAAQMDARGQSLFVEDLENITRPGGPSVDTARFGPLRTLTGLRLMHGSIDRTPATSMFSNDPDTNGDNFVNSADDAAFNTIVLGAGMHSIEPPPGATFPGPLPRDLINFDAPPAAPLSLVSSGRIHVELPCPASSVSFDLVAPAGLLYLITESAVRSAGGTLQAGPLGGFPVAGPFAGELSDPRGDFDQDGIGDSTGFAVVPGTGFIIATNDAEATGFLADVGFGDDALGHQIGRSDVGLAASIGPMDPTHVPFSRSVFGLTPTHPTDPAVDDLVVTFYFGETIVGSTIVGFEAPTDVTTTGLLEQFVSSTAVLPDRSLITAIEITPWNAAPGAGDTTWNGGGPDSYAFAIDNILVVADLPGDLDRDGDSDLADFLRFVAFFNDRRPPSLTCPRCDLDQDGDVDLSDLVAFQAGFTGPCSFVAAINATSPTDAESTARSRRRRSSASLWP